MVELFDEIWGAVNFIPKVIGALQTLLWRSRARNRQQYNKWAVVSFSFPRKDKGGRYNLDTVTRHLTHYGVTVVSWGYDSRRWKITIRKNQERWAAKLLGDAPKGGALYFPQKEWSSK